MIVVAILAAGIIGWRAGDRARNWWDTTVHVTDTACVVCPFCDGTGEIR